MSARSWLVAGLPLAAGVLAAVLTLLLGDVTLVVRGAPAGFALGLGVLGSVVLGAVLLVRERARSRAAAHLAAVVAAAQEDRRRLLMRLDHELKNPLTAVMVSLANLRSAVPTLDAEAGGALESAVAQSVRLSRIVGDLRKLTELETRPLQLAPVDLPELLAEVVDTLGDLPEAEHRSIRLTVPTAPWPLPPVAADRDLLFLAVLNLGLNAVKYSGPGDTVELRAAELGETVELEVADTGAGIPADEVGSVWDELVRGRAARAVPGTGLGLALVRTVVRRHGGTVGLRSREGHGTVVSLRLPVGTRLLRQRVTEPRHVRGTETALPPYGHPQQRSSTS